MIPPEERAEVDALLALAPTIEALREADFWVEVERLGWDREVKDARAVAERAALLWPLPQRIAFIAAFEQASDLLRQAFEHWELLHLERMPLSGRLLRELRDHLTGLGESTHALARRDPTFAGEKGERDVYLEGLREGLRASLLLSSRQERQRLGTRAAAKA